MPLIILGFVFAVGLFIFYLVSTSGGGGKTEETQIEKKEPDLKQEDNVIFLPNDIEKAKEIHRKK